MVVFFFFLGEERSMDMKRIWWGFFFVSHDLHSLVQYKRKEKTVAREKTRERERKERKKKEKLTNRATSLGH